MTDNSSSFIFLLNFEHAPLRAAPLSSMLRFRACSSFEHALLSSMLHFRTCSTSSTLHFRACSTSSMLHFRARSTFEHAPHRSMLRASSKKFYLYLTDTSKPQKIFLYKTAFLSSSVK